MIVLQKAFGYIRVSTSGQARDGYSLEYQREEIIKYASCNGFELVNIFEDAGVSGAKVDEDELTIEREGLQRMLEAIKDIKYVIVLNTSRLWRSDMVKILVQRDFKKRGIDIKSIEHPNYSIYKHDPTDILVNSIMEALDQYQRLEIAVKLGRGRKKKAEGGGYSGGKPAYGYTAKKSQKNLEVNETQARAVKRIFELRELNPDFSLSDIASCLNTEGYKTRENKSFTKVQVKRVLDHRDFYKGLYSYSEIKSTGQHKPIL